MKNIKKRISAAAVLALLIAVCSAPLTPMAAETGGTAGDTKTVRLYGDYHADISAALNRINASRKEACREGVPDPRDSSKKLSISDYKPIKWSSDLEEIARLRAAEASLTVSHTRPNGTSCFTAQSSNGIDSWGEVLAWNWSTSMVPGIDQWYEEKSDWVSQNENAVTGHYTQMIDPDHTYVGLGCFSNDYGVYYTTTSGEFSTLPSLDSSFGPAVNDTYVDIQIQKASVSSPRLLNISNEKSSFEVGETVNLRLAMSSSVEGYSATVFSAGTITWTSSNAAVVSVSDGLVKGLRPGNAVITAVDSDGISASKAITINKMKQNLKVSKAKKTVKYKTVRKKTVRTSKVKVTGVKTPVTYKKIGGSKKLTIDKTSGKIKVKKKTRKGTYKIKIKVTAKEGADYKAASKKATVTVRVK